jgi:hypothetical protein
VPQRRPPDRGQLLAPERGQPKVQGRLLERRPTARRPPKRGLLPDRQRLLAALAGLLNDARQIFRIWRRTRPFWGGLLVISGAGEILSSEQGPFQLVIHVGIQGLAGYLIPVMMLLCGVLLWFNPAQRTFYSLLSIVLALGSWITSNLGGFFIGMMLGIVGGALAVAWATGSDDQPLRWYRGSPQIMHAPLALELVLRPAAALPAPARAELNSAAGHTFCAEDTPDSAADQSAITSPESTGTLGAITSGALTGVEDARSRTTIAGETLRVNPPA